MLVIIRKLNSPPVQCTCACGRVLNVSLRTVARGRAGIGFEASEDDFKITRPYDDPPPPPKG